MATISAFFPKCPRCAEGTPGELGQLQVATRTVSPYTGLACTKCGWFLAASDLTPEFVAFLAAQLNSNSLGALAQAVHELGNVVLNTRGAPQRIVAR